MRSQSSSPATGRWSRNPPGFHIKLHPGIFYLVCVHSLLLLTPPRGLSGRGLSRDREEPQAEMLSPGTLTWGELCDDSVRASREQLQRILSVPTCTRSVGWDKPRELSRPNLDWAVSAVQIQSYPKRGGSCVGAACSQLDPEACALSTTSQDRLY